MIKKGISLVALVVTIIVLVILTGTVVLTVGKNGIIARAQTAVSQNDIAVAKEKFLMEIQNAKIQASLVNKNVSEYLADESIHTYFNGKGIVYDRVNVSVNPVVFVVDEKVNIETDLNGNIITVTTHENQEVQTSELVIIYRNSLTEEELDRYTYTYANGSTYEVESPTIDGYETEQITVTGTITESTTVYVDYTETIALVDQSFRLIISSLSDYANVDTSSHMLAFDGSKSLSYMLAMPRVYTLVLTFSNNEDDFYHIMRGRALPGNELFLPEFFEIIQSQNIVGMFESYGLTSAQEIFEEALYLYNNGEDLTNWVMSLNDRVSSSGSIPFNVMFNSPVTLQDISGTIEILFPG